MKCLVWTGPCGIACLAGCAALALWCLTRVV